MQENEVNPEQHKLKTTLPRIMKASELPQRQLEFVKKMLNKALWPANIRFSLSPSSDKGVQER